MKRPRPKKLPPPEVWIPKTIETVDSGGCAGWALWRYDGVLIECGISRPPYATIPKCEFLVIEIPHTGRGKARPRDVRKLAIRAGQIEQATGATSIVEIEPSRWKGTLDGDLMTERIWEECMTSIDRVTCSNDFNRKKIAKSYRHNTIDAIGIGIWFLKTKGIRRL